MRRWMSFVALLLVAAASANAQTEVVIDLSDPANVSTGIPVGTVKITVINMIPGKEYSVTTKVEPIIEAPVSIAAAKKATATPPVAPTTVPPVPPGAAICAPLVTAAQQAIAAATTGKELAAAIAETRKKAIESGCADVMAVADKACGDSLTAAQAAIKKVTTETEMSVATALLRAIRDVCPSVDAYLDSIELELEPIEVGRTEMLTVTIVRKDNNATWTRQYSTGKRGDWLTSYGIFIVPNRDANYSTFTVDTQRFQIRRSRDREAFDYVPTLTFTFMRPHKADQDWFLSPSFGIGYDLSSITGTVGYAYTYNHNFAISAGVMIHQQRRLKGKFEEDGHIGENLDNNDLTEMTWSPNVYVGITIRSLTNPFAR